LPKPEPAAIPEEALAGARAAIAEQNASDPGLRRLAREDEQFRMIGEIHAVIVVGKNQRSVIDFPTVIDRAKAVVDAIFGPEPRPDWHGLKDLVAQLGDAIEAKGD
jgi:hypothetical protein